MNDLFNQYLEAFGEFGVVTKIAHPLVVVEGLPLAKPNEIVIFESGQLGEVFSLNEDEVEIMVFSKEPVKIDLRVARTNKTLSVPVGKELLGTIIDPLGNPLTKVESFKQPPRNANIDNKPPGIASRAKIKKHLKTGVTVVDMMIPLGKGQKELVLGDRKTGKSSFLLASAKNQALENTLTVYAAIGKKKSDIKKLSVFFEKEKIQDKVVIVATDSTDSPSLIFLTPYTAMTIAEYFRDQGQDTLVIFDDLSTHAKFYREISLLAKRFPGRDSYPGDVFYTHAKLLERAGNFKVKDSEVSISCLPVAETVEGDLTNYIITNLIGITDGHIFFDSNAYYRGRRPAINIPLSVTRVGRQTQAKVKRHINRELTSFLTLYEKMQNLSHFGGELTESVKNILRTGDKVYRFFDQPYNIILPEEVQLVLFTLLWYQLINEEEQNQLYEYRENLTNRFSDKKVQILFSKILAVDTFNELLTNVNKNREEILRLCKTNEG